MSDDDQRDQTYFAAAEHFTLALKALGHAILDASRPICEPILNRLIALQNAIRRRSA
jgi:hypothetical protein